MPNKDWIDRAVQRARAQAKTHESLLDENARLECLQLMARYELARAKAKAKQLLQQHDNGDIETDPFVRQLVRLYCGAIDNALEVLNGLKEEENK
jgi:phage terminase Nu1 subunit (DNA packaging protein)